ncbi:MAG: DUF3795 domain-containing protein [Candidatus Natronoplasma sp.]
MPPDQNDLIGRCGHYCGSCIIYRAYQDSEELRENIAERNDCQPEDINCEGCQTVLESGWESHGDWGKNCDIIKCLEAKGYRYCYECQDIDDCEIFNDWYEYNLKKGEDLKKNLERIENGETEEWLKEKKEKWKCDSCKKPISITLEECHWCGSEI